MKILFISTNSFPCDRTETLLEAKIYRLSEEFDLIFIITAAIIQKEIIQLPSNVTFVSVNLNMTFFDKIKSFFGVFSNELYRELKFVILKDRIPSWNKIKVALNAYYKSKKYVKIVLFLMKNNNIKESEDNIYFHSYWTTDFSVAYSSLKSKYPKAFFYSRFHAYDLYAERHEPIYLPFRKRIYENCNKLFFISEQGMQYFISNYSILDNKKMVVNYLGVPTKDENISKYEHTDPVKNELIVVSCSSMIELKRIHLIIDSLSLVNDIQIIWYHFGDGVLKRELTEYAAEKLDNKSNVVYNFKGHVINKDIISFYSLNHIDLFVNVSEFEGVPISIMEAMSYGIPCVATNVGGVCEIINDENGFLLEVGFHPFQLTNLLIKFKNLNSDEKSRFCINANSKIRSQFDIKNNFESFIAEIKS